MSRDGQAANFAETEQILWVEPGTESGRLVHVSAYLQTRGSAPVLWSQPVDLHYNPPFHIADELSMEARAAFRAHVEEQRARYGAPVGGVTRLSLAVAASSATCRLAHLGVGVERVV